MFITVCSFELFDTVQMKHQQITTAFELDINVYDFKKKRKKKRRQRQLRSGPLDVQLLGQSKREAATAETSLRPR